MRGFTLLEMLLSVALLSIIFGMSYALYPNLAYQEELDVAVRSSQALLRRAAALASASEGDSPWGVRFESSTAVLFKGTSYAGRDTAYDETLLLEGIEVSGTGEYVFEKVSSEPITSGTTTLLHTAGESKAIIVNEKGRITIE